MDSLARILQRANPSINNIASINLRDYPNKLSESNAPTNLYVSTSFKDNKIYCNDRGKCISVKQTK